MWEIIVSPTPAKAFRKLTKRDRGMAIRIKQELNSLRMLENPRDSLKPLEGYYPPNYSARVGDYRIVVELDDNRHVIFVRGIGHRKNVYDRL